MATDLAVGVALGLLRRKGAGPYVLLLAREVAIALGRLSANVVDSLATRWCRPRPTLRRLRRRAAQAATAIYVLFVVVFLLPLTLFGVASNVRRLPEPDFPIPYLIAREGDVVRFAGDIDRRSAAVLLRILQQSGVATLKINSVGGLIGPAWILAEAVHTARLHVEVDPECSSACTILLAASPTATVRPDSVVMLHRARLPAPSDSHGTTDAVVLDPSADETLREALERYGVRSWAVDRINHLTLEEEWYPDLLELDDIGLVMFVRDPATDRLLRPRDYCSSHPSPRC